MASIIDHDPSARPDLTFDAIAATIAETARGRWFLAEFAQRNRTADTEMLLTALARIESAIGFGGGGAMGGAPNAALDAARAELDSARSEFARLAAAARIEAPPLEEAAGTLEASTADILDAAESIQDATWILRDRGADPSLCDGLDRQAAAIYAACARQDLAAQQTFALARTVQRLDEILAAEAPSPTAPKDRRRPSAPPRLPPARP